MSIRNELPSLRYPRLIVVDSPIGGLVNLGFEQASGLCSMQRLAVILHSLQLGCLNDNPTLPAFARTLRDLAQVKIVSRIAGKSHIAKYGKETLSKREECERKTFIVVYQLDSQTATSSTWMILVWRHATLCELARPCEG